MLMSVEPARSVFAREKILILLPGYSFSKGL